MHSLDMSSAQPAKALEDIKQTAARSLEAKRRKMTKAQVDSARMIEEILERLGVDLRMLRADGPGEPVFGEGRNEDRASMPSTCVQALQEILDIADAARRRDRELLPALGQILPLGRSQTKIVEGNLKESSSL